MHLQDGPDVDLSAQVARAVKEKTRPWWSIIALALAIAAAITSAWARSFFQTYFTSDQVPYQIIAAASAAAFCVFGSLATYGLSRKARSILEPRVGAAHAAVVQYLLLLIGGFATLAITLALFHVPVSQLLLGGALTSVFVGIAAQQSLSNVFAGMVLLLARPFRVGDPILLRAGALGGELTGTVTEIGITYVRLDTGASVMAVPNSQVLNAVVGPQPQQAESRARSESLRTAADDQPKPPGRGALPS
jgi:small-conductance mechanosensitive channel